MSSLRTMAAPVQQQLAGGVVGFIGRLVGDYTPFALLVVYHGRFDEVPAELRPLSPHSRPLRERRAEVGTWCRSVAYASPDASMDAWTIRAAERLWGCRCRAFSDLAAAWTWIIRDLAGAGAVAQPLRVYFYRERRVCIAAAQADASSRHTRAHCCELAAGLAADGR